jgi:hypothetical protein
MVMSKDDMARHEAYEQSPERIRIAIDEAYDEAVSVLKRAGLLTANDDRAEILIGALWKYVQESGNDVGNAGGGLV